MIDLQSGQELAINPNVAYSAMSTIKIPILLNMFRALTSDPSTDITSSTFGQALYQGSPGGTFGQQSATYGTGNTGRQVELGLKITF